MKSETIELLNQSDEHTAVQIFTLFQQAYRHEANLIGVPDFPPLRRTIAAIRTAESVFWGCRKAGVLAGVIEVNAELPLRYIDSLVVRPSAFGGGIATRLVMHVLDHTRWNTVEVCTAARNHPALSLYDKLGFIRQRTWTSKEGIALITLTLEEKNAGATSDPRHG